MPEDTPEQKFRKMVKTDEGWEEFDKQLSNINVPCVIQPLSQDKEREIILTTGTVFDDLFGGGLSAGQTVEMYGEYASGKSQTLFTMTVEAASKGLVIFVDTEDTFSRKRTLQIAQAREKDIEKVNNNIWLYKPESWEAQLAIGSQIPDETPSPIRLIVVDSLMALFVSTPEFAGRARLGKRQELIRWHLRQLKKLAKKHGAIVVYTNQVYDEPDANPFLAKWASQHPRGGHSVAHIGDYRIFLRKASGNVRIARLVDNSEVPPSERVFQINEKGIDDLSREQQEEAMKRVQKYEKQQMKGEIVKKKKKDEKEEENKEEDKEEKQDGEKETS